MTRDGLPAAATAAPTTATAAVAATAAATTTEAPATTATTTAFAGLGDVDDKRSAAHLLAVEGIDGRLGLPVVGHLDEPEPAGTAGLAIHHNAGARDRSILREHLLEFRFRGGKRQVSDVNVCHGQILGPIVLTQPTRSNRGEVYQLLPEVQIPYPRVFLCRVRGGGWVYGFNSSGRLWRPRRRALATA